MIGADPSRADPGMRVMHAAHRDVLSGALGSWRENRTWTRAPLSTCAPVLLCNPCLVHLHQ